MASDPLTDKPDDLFRRHGETKAHRHAHLLIALGATTEREPYDQAGDEGEREPPQAPAV